jgi:uncharacterized protein YdhG (YjbR/CyaY superfamily)
MLRLAEGKNGYESGCLKNIDEYIARFPIEVQETLQKIRKIVQKAAPEATEKISYQMPTFYLFGNLVQALSTFHWMSPSHMT